MVISCSNSKHVDLFTDDYILDCTIDFISHTATITVKHTF